MADAPILRSSTPSHGRDQTGVPSAVTGGWPETSGSISQSIRAGAKQPAAINADYATVSAVTSAPTEPDPDLLRMYHRFAIFAGIATTAIGALALIGWLAGIPLLTSLSPSWIAMKANTAVGLIVTGGALALAASGRPTASPTVRFCAVFVFALGVATLFEYASGRSLGIDQLLVVEPPGAIGTTDPGRMGPVAAMNFAICAMALLTTTTHRWKWISGALALLVALVSLVALLGYLFGANELYTLAGNITGVAAPTSAAFLLSACGIIAVWIDRGPLRWLTSPYSGGVMLRRLLPLTLLLPPVIVWLQLRGQAAGVFGSIEFGAATVAVAVILSVSIGLLWCAAWLDGLDRKRARGEVRIRQLNAVLHDRVSALELANKELEGFSYATSHVFLSPLRAIDGFSRILLDEYADKLDSEGKRLLGILRSSALDVHELIDGILGFLRLGREVSSPGPVDMAELVQSVCNELAPKTRGRELKIEILPLPASWGDAAMIKRVWVNLLDNAVKFTAPKPAARIEVGGTRGVDETVYYVRDTGVGFDTQYASRLFRVFSQLHGAQFAGNGMGLAIVQRVVVRHGGRVWAEGKVDEGATFYFALPTKETANASSR